MRGYVHERSELWAAYAGMPQGREWCEPYQPTFETLERRLWGDVRNGGSVTNTSTADNEIVESQKYIYRNELTEFNFNIETKIVSQ